jgi:RimJ/RimL family protein N-acetyltransferase
MALPSAPLPRVLLRPLDSATTRAILDGDRRPDWSAGYPTAGDRDIARFLFEHPRTSDPRPLWLPHQILDAASGTVIGSIGCHRPPDAQWRVEIGYGIAEEWRNQGYTTEAVRTLVGALGAAGVKLVIARTNVDNEPSQAVLRHTAFQRIGVGIDGLIIWHLPLD